MFDRRFQILLDEGRYERVRREAAERGVSVATVIREAIRPAFSPSSPTRVAAARRILSAPDMPVPDPGILREELQEIRGRGM